MKVIVSLTSIPPRFSGLASVVESITQQTMKPDAIEINIPHCYSNPKFNNASLDALPAELTVFRTAKDWGPATKIIPTLERHKTNDTTIIYLDDDRIYRNNLIKELINVSKKYPKNAIAAHTVSVKRQLIEAYWKNHQALYRALRLATLGFWNPKRSADDYHHRIAEGFGGVLVRPSFFSDEVFNYPQELRSVDDVWISGMLTLTGCGVVTAKHLQPSTQPNISNGQDTGQLEALVSSTHENLNRFQANAKCIKYLQNKYGVWQ